MRTSSRRVAVGRAVPELVAAQVTGAVGGLMVGLDQLRAPGPQRPKIVDKSLTRC